MNVNEHTVWDLESTYKPHLPPVCTAFWDREAWRKWRRQCAQVRLAIQRFRETGQPTSTRAPTREVTRG